MFDGFVVLFLQPGWVDSMVLKHRSNGVLSYGGKVDFDPNPHLIQHRFDRGLQYAGLSGFSG